MTVNEIYERLEALYPSILSCSWDNDGRMVVPDGDREVRRAVCCLDCDMRTVAQAVRFGADLILSHHPLIFRPLRALDCADPVAAKALLLYTKGIAVLSFHTRLDCAKGGVNDTLAGIFGLQNVGEVMIGGLPMGRIGTLPEECTGAEFARKVKERAGCPSLRIVNPEKRVRTVALLGGSGGSNYKDAIAAGADAYLTGEASHHQMLDAEEAGLCLIAAGHDYTERPIAHALCAVLKELDPSVEVIVEDGIAVDTL